MSNYAPKPNETKWMADVKKREKSEQQVKKKDGIKYAKYFQFQQKQIKNQNQGKTTHTNFTFAMTLFKNVIGENEGK